MKKTLLQIVQDILIAINGEPVNSISDTQEAQDIASYIQTTYFNITVDRLNPEHKELIKLTALSDSNFPSHFSIPDSVRDVETLWYKNSDGDYREICYEDPLTFLARSDKLKDSFVSVYDKNAGTELRIRNDKDPEYFTSFDNLYIILDSYNSTEDSTLQESKVRAYGTTLPVFTISDSFIPDLDSHKFPYLISEATSLAMSLDKGGADPKIEQWSRRHKSYIQNDQYRINRPKNWSAYGR